MSPLSGMGLSPYTAMPGRTMSNPRSERVIAEGEFEVGHLEVDSATARVVDHRGKALRLKVIDRVVGFVAAGEVGT